MKEYIKPEVEYVQLITEAITIDLGSGSNPFLTSVEGPESIN